MGSGREGRGKAYAWGEEDMVAGGRNENGKGIFLKTCNDDG